MKRLAGNLLIFIMLGSVALTIMQSCKHEPLFLVEAIPPARITNPDTGKVIDGIYLYSNNCAGCHGALPVSQKLGATVAQIQTGISSVNNMHIFSSFSIEQLQAIADVLKTTNPPSPVTDGATLYANNCAGCHGDLATSQKLGATVSQIKAGINTVSSMSGFSSLTSGQLQAISDVLASVPMPTDGPTLYSMKCASCHDVLSRSSAGGASVSEIQQAIREKNQMKFLSTLTLTQIQAIAGALAGINGGD